MKKSILFITTYKARDFNGQALVGYQLNKNDSVESFYVHGYGVEREIAKLKPSILVMDHLVWNHKKKLAKWASDIGVKVVLLFTEGYYKDISSFDKIFGHPNADLLGIESFFVWNESMIERVKCLGYSKEFIDKFILTGCPRFDFLTNQSLKNFTIEENLFLKKYNLDKYSKVVTYMSTTPYQGYSYEKFYSRYSKKANYPDVFIKNIFDDNQRQFNNHSELIRNLAINNPNIAFIYKAHPSEAYISNYDKYFKGVENIIFIYNENVVPFIRYSSLVLQRNCTTALESWLLGKIVIQIDDDQYNSKTYSEHNKFSYIARDYNELEKYINNDSLKQKNESDLKDFLVSIFGILNGESYQNVVNELKEILRKWTNQDQIKLNNNLKKYLELDSNRLPNKIKDFLGLDRKTSLRPRVYFKKVFFKKKKNNLNEVSVSKDEVQKVYEEFAKYL